MCFGPRPSNGLPNRAARQMRKASSKQISRRSKRIAIKLIRKRILRNRKYQRYWQ